MAEILIIKLGALGDVFQSEGALRDIREHHPDARITVLTGPPYRALLERCPWVDRVWTDPRAPRWRLDRMLALRKMLRGARFERVYDLQNSARTAFYYHWFLRGVPWSGTAAGCSLPHRHPAPKTVPVLERLAGQFADAGVPVRHTPHPDLSWAADPVDELLARAWVSAPFVLLLAGSSARNPQKRWPYYPQLAEWLIAEGIQVVTAPGPDEIALCRMIPGTMLTVGDEAGGKGSGKGSGKGIGRHLDFFKLAGVIRAARLVVGNDSGPTHLAAHLGVPGIALFGGHTSSALTGIARPNMTILEETPLADLSVERVHAAVLDRLGIAAEVPSGL